MGVAGEQQFDSWQRGIRRISFRVFAGFGVTVALLQTRSLLVGVDHGRSVAVTALEIALLVTVAARGWLGTLNRGDVAACIVLLAVTAATSDSSSDPTATGGDSNPDFFFLATTLLLCIVVLRGLAVPLVGVGATGVYLAASVLVGDRALGPSVDESVLLATAHVSVWIVVRELERSAVRADRAHHRAIAQQGVAARRTAEQQTTLEARRTLHDRVLTALLLLVHATADKLPSVRTECREAATAIGSLAARAVSAVAATTDVQLHRRLETEAVAAAAATGVAARVQHRRARRTLRLPGPVGDAMSGAVAEALRNVGRHAGVGDADVVVTAADGGGLLVEVVDHGRGLPAGSPVGFGLRHSVSARLREIGGTARIDASPEGGTRVALRWAPEDAPGPTAPTSSVPGVGSEVTRISEHPRAFAAAFAATLVLGSGYLALRYPFAGTSRWADLAVLSVVLAHGAGCILAIPHPHVLRRLHHAGFVVLPGVLAAGLYLGGAGSLRGFGSWVVSLAAAPVLLLAMARPVVPVLALVFLESAVVAVAAVLDPALSPLEVLAPITQTPMYALLLVWGVSAIRRLRRTAALDEDAAAAALAQTQAVEARQHAIETHYAWLDSDVRPFLDAVADHDLGTADPEVQQHASILALAVRDELALPAQLSEGVRHLIAAARRRGTRVHIRAGDEWPSASAQAELEQVLGLLTQSDGDTEITVSLPQESSARLRVVVRPRLTPAQHAACVALLGAALQEIDEDDLVSIITLDVVDPERA